MKFKILAFAALAATCLSSASNAAVVYDYTIPAPGWYAGTANPNGAFTHNDNGNGYAIDLRAKNRQDPTVITPVGNVYSVAPGAQPGNPLRAIWNYEFGITCSSCDASSGAMAALLGASTMTVSDLTKGTSGTVSMDHWLDDDMWSGGAEHDGNTFYPFSIMAENSENLTFADSPLAGYNMNDEDYYRFTINLMDPTTLALLVTNTIDVAVGSAQAPASVPEPLTLTLFGAGLVGAGVLRRRRKRPVG